MLYVIKCVFFIFSVASFCRFIRKVLGVFNHSFRIIVIWGKKSTGTRIFKEWFENSVSYESSVNRVSSSVKSNAGTLPGIYIECVDLKCESRVSDTSDAEKLPSWIPSLDSTTPPLTVTYCTHPPPLYENRRQELLSIWQPILWSRLYHCSQLKSSLPPNTRKKPRMVRKMTLFPAITRPQAPHLICLKTGGESVSQISHVKSLQSFYMKHEKRMIL